MSDLPPPPGSGGTGAGPFVQTWSPLSGSSSPPPPSPLSGPSSTPPLPPSSPDDERYATPPPPSRRSTGTGCLIAGTALVSLVVGVIATIAVVSLDDGDAYSGGSSGTGAASAGSSESTAVPPLELPDLPPLEHDLDLYGPVGTCVDGTTYANVTCEQDHGGEVFARLAVSGDEFPGADVLQDDYANTCEGEFDALAGESSAEAGLAVIGSQPSEAAWDNGLHEVVCIAMSFGGTNEGSIVDG